MALVQNEFVSLEYLVGSVYTAVGQLLSVKPPGVTVASVKTTARGDTAQEFRPGAIPDFGEVSGRLQYDPDNATHTALLDLLETPVAKSWQVVHKDSAGSALATAAFSGFLTSWDPVEGEEESDYEVNFTIKVSGVVTWS